MRHWEKHLSNFKVASLTTGTAPLVDQHLSCLQLGHQHAFHVDCATAVDEAACMEVTMANVAGLTMRKVVLIEAEDTHPE